MMASDTVILILRMFGCLQLEPHVAQTVVNNNSIVCFDVVGVACSSNFSS